MSDNKVNIMTSRPSPSHHLCSQKRINKRSAISYFCTFSILLIIFTRLEFLNLGVEFHVQIYYQNSSSPLFEINNSRLLHNNKSHRKGKGNFTYPFSKDRERQCTSPEQSVDWIFGNENEDCEVDEEDKVFSRTSHRRCHLCHNNNETKFLKFLNELSTGLSSKYNVTCSRLVTYSVAFGTKYTHNFNVYIQNHVKTIHSYHNRCFFTFVLAQGSNNYEHNNFTQLKSTEDGKSMHD